MAKKQAVWGIDIGLCSIKALRCTTGENPGDIVADKFDYIEFPKMLNQPEVDAEEEIRAALTQFLARNDVKGDFVAISVPGQTGLPRFFRPPPVDLKTLPEIVKYEVKQQIPFPIEDVIWDWQRLGGVVVDDRVVDSEVGLFAMKREAVYKALKPFDDAGVEVDLIQLSPLSVFNFVTHDVFDSLPTAEDFDPENPPESTVVMSMGTDTTDLIVTNGIKLWLRNIPVGGNHFTKQLSREMKLTHAKAEHLKRNARQAEDPKSVFRSMRPVFNDLVNEVQRSLTFYRSIDKNAKLSRIVLVGNSAKLPGIRQFLTAQLEMDIVKVSEFSRLSGNEVVGQSTFDENMLTFAPAYGLCIQGLKQALLKTNLLPPEIQEDRIVRAKKPWVLAAISMMMLGMLIGWFMKSNAWYRSSPSFTVDNVSWAQSFSDVKSVKQKSQSLMSEDAALKTKLERVNRLNSDVVSESERKTQWLELTRAINAALPVDERLAGLDAVDSIEIPFEDRETLYIQYVESFYASDLSDYYLQLVPYFESQFEASTDEIEQAAEAGAEKVIEEEEVVLTPEQQAALMKEQIEKMRQQTGPVKAEGTQGEFQRPGWIIEIAGHHYHNSIESMNQRDRGRAFLVRTMIDKIANGTITLPGAEDAIEGGGEYLYSEFGLYYPSLVAENAINKYKIPYTVEASVLNIEQEKMRRDGDGDKGGDRPGDAGRDQAGGQGNDAGGDQDADADANPNESDEDKKRREELEKIARNGGIEVEQRYEFTVQIIWVPRSPRERFALKQERLKKEKDAAAVVPADPQN